VVTVPYFGSDTGIFGTRGRRVKFSDVRPRITGGEGGFKAGIFSFQFGGRRSRFIRFHRRTAPQQNRRRRRSKRCCETGKAITGIG